MPNNMEHKKVYTAAEPIREGDKIATFGGDKVYTIQTINRMSNTPKEKKKECKCEHHDEDIIITSYCDIHRVAPQPPEVKVITNTRTTPTVFKYGDETIIIPAGKKDENFPHQPEEVVTKANNPKSNSDWSETTLAHQPETSFEHTAWRDRLAVIDQPDSMEDRLTKLYNATPAFNCTESIRQLKEFVLAEKALSRAEERQKIAESFDELPYVIAIKKEQYEKGRAEGYKEGYDRGYNDGQFDD